MKTKFNGFLTLLLVLVVQFSFAQEKIISGVVSDEYGPVGDITVLIKGTDVGTATDFDGNYTLKAKTGDVLVFSHISYETIESAVGESNVINMKLVESGNKLDIVVVTAQGIKKSKKSLGYAVSNINGEDLAQKAEGDISRILGGKISGVRVNSSSGLSGSGTRVVIRGITGPGNNNPLYVVDGVPVNADTNGSGTLESSRSVDLDPNNIASISVLKGLSAATLYGSDGRNGVILITTKNGQGGNFNEKTEVTISQSYFINKIASLPKFSKRRGRGYYGLYYQYSGNWGADFGTTGQFGIDENGLVPHPLSGRPNTEAYPEFNGATTEYKRYNGHEDFFETGTVSSTSINISGGNENTSFNVSYGKLNDKGFIGGNQLERDNFGIGGNMKLNNKFSVNATLNGAFTKFETPLVGSILSSLYDMNTDYDLINLPFQSPIDGSEIYYKTGNNPLWLQNNAGSNQKVDRFFGKFQVNYEINSWMNASYRIGLDTYTELNRLYINKGATSAIFNTETSDTDGRLYSDSYRSTVVDHTLMLSIDKDLSNDLNISSNIGATAKKRTNSYQYTDSYEQNVFDYFEHQNFTNHNSGSDHLQINRPALFAQFTLDYKNYLYFTGNVRNEWSSDFINDSKLYPGASVSFLPTTAFTNLKSKYLNFLKLRVAYGTSAGFEVPNTRYATFTSLGLNSQAFTDQSGTTFQTFTVPNVAANTEIDPFLISELEFGIETMMINKRITLDLSFYNRKTSDLIFDRPFDPSSGYTSQTQNVNEFKTDGLEIDLGLKPIKTSNFEWNINVLFSKSDSEVTELDEESIPYQIVNGGPLGNYYIKGEPVTTIMGTVVLRDDNGNMMLTAGGDQYLIDPEHQIIGDANPDFVSSLYNEFRYKNLRLGVSLEYRKGGDIYSSTARTLLLRGSTEATDNVDAAAGYVLPGVLPDGTQNNIVQDTGDLYLNLFQTGADEFNIFDGTTVRLKEISLGYELPKEMLKKTPFGSVSFTLSGQNLWFKAVNFPEELNIDTNAIGTSISGNGTGFELNSSPSSKRYGLSLKATF